MTSSSNILWEEELKDMESGSLALPLQCHPSVEAHYNVSVFITVSIYVKSQFQSYYAIFVFFLWYRSGLLLLGLYELRVRDWRKERLTGSENYAVVWALVSKLSFECRVPWLSIPVANWLELTGPVRSHGTLCRQRRVCCQVIHPASTYKQLVV